MRLVFAGPNSQDDPYVHSIMRQRVEIASTPWDVKMKPDDVHTPEQEKRFTYQVFLENLQAGIEPIREVVSLSPVYKDGKKETDLLDGHYQGYRQWHDMEIPKMRMHLRAAMESGTEEAVLLHIDLGDCLGTLIYAYHAAMLGLPYLLTFHNPPQPVDPEAERVTFAIGGHSDYARLRPMIRRHMAVAALRDAERVFVDQDGIGGALDSLFPQFKQTYYADALTAIPSAEVVDDLPSHVAEG